MIVELSRTSLLQRIGIAKRGQWVMYHVGFLFADRIKDRRLNSTAGEAWMLYKLGTVVLVQRRLGDMQYEYYAVKR